MDETLTISQLEDTYIEDLNMLGDWFLQYEYLLELSSELSTIPEEDRKEENKVHGYQSGVAGFICEKRQGIDKSRQRRADYPRDAFGNHSVVKRPDTGRNHSV